jgi:hypothetical protein
MNRDLRRLLSVGIFCLLAPSFGLGEEVVPTECDTSPELLSADCSGDGILDVSDPICLLGWLFLGGRGPHCIPASGRDVPCSERPEFYSADGNGDGIVDVSDAIRILGWLFLGSPAPECPRFPVSLEIEPSMTSVPLGLEVQFAVMVTFQDGTREDMAAGATWESSETAVAAFGGGSAAGRARTLSAGTSEITAMFGGVSSSTTLTVGPSRLVSIAISPENARVGHYPWQRCRDIQFSAMGVYTDGSETDITTTVSWTSSNPAAVSFGSGGVATACENGTWIITAAAEGLSAGTELEIFTIPDWDG